MNFRKEVAKHKLQGFRKTDMKSVFTNYIKLAASTGNVDMVRLLASRKASTASQVEALDTAVKQNLPGVVESLLQFDVDPNSLGGTIFQSAITNQKPTTVKLLLRARKGLSKSLLNDCLPITVEQGQIELASLLVLHGADVNHSSALALRRAVQSQRSDLLLAIMKGKPSNHSVSSAFEDAHRHSRTLFNLIALPRSKRDFFCSTFYSVVVPGGLLSPRFLFELLEPATTALRDC